MSYKGRRRRWTVRLCGWASIAVWVAMGAVPAAATEPRPEHERRVRAAMEQIRNTPTRQVWGAKFFVSDAIRGIVDSARLYRAPSARDAPEAVVRWVQDERFHGLERDVALGALQAEKVQEAYRNRHAAPHLVRATILDALAEAVKDPVWAMRVGCAVGKDPKALHPALAYLAAMEGPVEITRVTVEEALGKSLSLVMAAHTTTRRAAWNALADVAMSKALDMDRLVRDFDSERSSDAQHLRSASALQPGADLDAVLPIALLALHQLGDSARKFRNGHWVETPGSDANVDWSIQASRLMRVLHEGLSATGDTRAQGVLDAAEGLERFYPSEARPEPQMAAEIKAKEAEMTRATELLSLVPVASLGAALHAARAGVAMLLGEGQVVYSEPDYASFTASEIVEALWNLLAEEPEDRRRVQ